MNPLLRIEDLQTCFARKDGLLKAVDGVSLQVETGETVALVGESGSGKTVTAYSILRLVPPPGRILAGTISFRGQDLLSLTENQLADIRGKEIGLIMQDAASALNPVMRVGEQIAEVLRRHFAITSDQAKQDSLALMEKVQLPNVGKIYSAYPHELSGGQRQRIMIAIALACKPALVIADEPTTALDVSIQSQILTLLQQLKVEFQLSLLWITHDLGIVAQMADRVAVMYAGRIVEQAPTRELFASPEHPYTEALLRAVPKPEFPPKDAADQLPISGFVPDLMNLPSGCAFHPRCPIAEQECREITPSDVIVSAERTVKCLKREPDHEKITQV